LALSCHPLEGACQVGMAKPVAGQRRPVLGEVGCRAHPAVFPTRPDLRSVSCRAEPAPATHQDQGDGISTGMIPAPGTVWRPRKSSSSAGRVRAIEKSQAPGCPEGCQHLVAHGRRADRSLSVCGRGGSIQAPWFSQHQFWLPPRPTSLSEEPGCVEVHLVPHHVVGGSCELVSQRSDRDDVVGLRPLALEVPPGLLVVAVRMMCCL